MPTETTERKTPSVREFKKWCRQNKPLAVAACEARAYAEVTRKKVDAYILPVFQSFNFVYEGDAIERMEPDLLGKPILSPDDSAFCLLHGKDESEELQAKLRDYYAACDRAHSDNGFKDLKPGQCPALVAENLQRNAERELVDSGARFMGLSEGQPYRLEDRKKLLNLLMGACLNVPGKKVTTIFGQEV